jgi:hypothetical protein
MLVIPVDMVVDKKRIIGNNVGPRRRRGTRGGRQLSWTPTLTGHELLCKDELFLIRLKKLASVCKAHIRNYDVNVSRIKKKYFRFNFETVYSL